MSGKGSKRRPEAKKGSYDAEYERMVKEGTIRPPQNTHSQEEES